MHQVNIIIWKCKWGSTEALPRGLVMPWLLLVAPCEVAHIRWQSAHISISGQKNNNYMIYMVQYAVIQFYRLKYGSIDVFSFALNQTLLQATSSNITHFFQDKKCPDIMLKKIKDFRFLRDFFTNIWEIFLKNLIFNFFLFLLSFNI